jgi:hypothetical protein
MAGNYLKDVSFFAPFEHIKKLNVGTFSFK